MRSYKISGNKLDQLQIEKTSFSSVLIEKIKTEVTFYQIDTTTRAEGKASEDDLSDDGMVYYEFEDKSYLFLSPDEVHQLALREKSVYSRGSDIGSNEELYLSTSFAFDNTRDGWLKKGIAKIVSFISGDVLDKFIEETGEFAAKKIAKKLELKSVTEEGLFKINSSRILEKFIKSDATGPYFLFIHGTNSNTRNAFFDPSNSENEKISNTLIWEAINSSYGSNILAFEHHTLTKSPFENVLLLADKLPDNIELTIMSHSRGGLVADTLLMCIDMVKQNKLESVLAYLEEENRNEDAQVVSKISSILKGKKINISQVIKVASPGNGTTLLSDNIINLLRVITEVTKWVNKSVSQEIIELLEKLIVVFIKSKDKTDVLPGLEAMTPDNSYLDLINTYSVIEEPKCYLLAGQSSMSLNIIHSLKFFFTRMLIQDHSDMVVNTISMLQGLSLKGAFYNKATGNRVHHSSYFYQQNTAELITTAIKTKGILNSSDIVNRKALLEEERGVTLENGNYLSKDISGRKPVTILIPGMMASTLKKGNDQLWIDYWGFPGGSLFKMGKEEKLEVAGVIATAYESFCKFLINSGHDVYVIPYDWRLSYESQLSMLEKEIEAVFKLAGNQPIRVVSHSKGGLLLRQLFLDKSEVYNRLSSRQGFRWIMLGTPWYGSYAAVKTIIGQSKTLRSLRILSGVVSTQRLLKIFSKYPGVLEMLPMDITTTHDQQFDFSDINVWQNIHTNDYKNKHKWVVPPIAESQFKTIKEKVEKIKFSNIEEPGKLNKTNIFYIAGTHEETPKSLKYNQDQKTYYCENSNFEGDSTVTWKEGFPVGMEENNKYFVNTKHDRLLDDQSFFKSILQLLETGKCNLSNTPPAISTRSADQEFVPSVYKTRTIDTNERFDVINKIFGKDDITSESSKPELINVSISHGDLKFASGPLMVGHFNGEFIANAEFGLDKALGGYLSDRFKNKVYPGPLGSSLFILREAYHKPVGALIVGLGNQFDLTGFSLSIAIKEAIINAYHQHKENDCSNKCPFPDQWSTLLIGTAFGNLSIATSVKSIISGVEMANKSINETKKFTEIYENLIKHVEFIELFHDKVYSVYYAIRQFESDGLLRFENKVLTSKPGGVNKLSISYVADRWNQMTIRGKKNCPLKIDHCLRNNSSLIFDLNIGIAKEESNEIFINKPIIDKMLFDLIQEKEKLKTWDRRISKVLFERLIPQSFKTNLRMQNNMVLNLDNESASYPWELIQDTSVNDKPLCVSAGLIRQLNTNKCGPEKRYAEGNKILIIGDPDLNSTKYRQLSGAAAEAREVSEVFQSAKFEVIEQIRKLDYEIIQSIYSEPYRIIHIAAHGDFDPKNTFKSGIVIGCLKTYVKDNEGNNVQVEEPIFLTATDIVQLDPIPEFVFINTCYSGKNTSEASDFSYKTYEFASNIGEQFIKEGVRAIIVAGWPVYDDSALYFAQTFYQEMFEGANFGQAVQKAREACYEYDPDKNTWGAYQCYGDPMYKFDTKSYHSKKKLNLDIEILNEYNSIISQAEMSKTLGRALKKQLAEVDDALELLNIQDANVLEKQAMAHYKLGNNLKASSIFVKLFTIEKANFSLKSLEQIYNVQAKIAVEEAINDKSKIGNSIKELEKVIEKFEILIKIGPTSERYSMLGSTFKRLAFIQKISNNNGFKTSIQKSIESYEEANKFKSKKYPFYNSIVLLQLNFLNNKTINKDLTNLIKQFKSEKFNDDYYDQINWFNVLVTQYLVNGLCKDQNDKILKNDDILNFLKNAFDAVWNNYGAFNHLKGEYEHLEIIIEFLQKKDKRRSVLKEVIDHIRNIEKTKNQLNSN